MGLKDKLIGLRDTVTEYAQEIIDTKDMTADEYARYYGASYQNMLSFIRREIIIALDDEDMKEELITVNIPIRSVKDNKIIFNNNYFGQKESFDYSVLKTLFYKERITCVINDEQTEMSLSIDKSVRLQDRINDLIDNREIYYDTAKSVLSDVVDVSKAGLKKALNAMSEWADKKL